MFDVKGGGVLNQLKFIIYHIILYYQIISINIYLYTYVRCLRVSYNISYIIVTNRPTHHHPPPWRSLMALWHRHWLLSHHLMVARRVLLPMQAPLPQGMACGR